jgi:Bacterial membrane protein YfhO
VTAAVRLRARRRVDAVTGGARWVPRSSSPRLLAAIIYAILSLLLVGPALLPGKALSTSDSLWFYPPWLSSRPAQLVRPASQDIGDAPLQFQPFLQYTRRRLPNIPLWNPYIMGGRPFLADGQSAIFSPFSIPAYVLPLWRALAWIAALKLWVAAFGMFLLGRALGMRFGGALLAGLVYGLNLYMVTYLAFPHSGVWALIPWALLATERLIRQPDPVSAVGLATVVGVQFLCGHPESSFHLLVATVLFFVLRLLSARRAATGAFRARGSVAAFTLALAGGTAVAALVLLPFAELLLHSADIHQRAGVSVDVHLERKWLLEVLLPDFWGRPTQSPITTFLLARAFYAGALPLMLAAAALLLRRDAQRLWVAVFGFIGLAVVVGIPPFLQIISRLPVFSSGHNGRLVVFYLLALALLAGWGLDDVCALAGSGRARRRVLVVATVLLLVPVVIVIAGGYPVRLAGSAFRVAWGFIHPPPVTDPNATGVIRLGSLIVWLTVAGGGLLLLVLRLRRRLTVPVFVTLAVLLVVVDLFRAGMGQNPAIPAKYAAQPATGAIRYLQSQRPARFVATQDFPQNVIGMRYQVLDGRGYDFPIMSRYDRLWRREISPEYPSQVGSALADITLTLPKVTEPRLRALRLLGVTDLMQTTTAFGQPLPVLRLPGLRLVYNGSDARVYHLDGALPRVVVAGAQQTVGGGEAALNAVTRPGFDARAVAVTEHRLAGLPEVGAAGVAESAGNAKITSYQPETVTVRASATRTGLVVLNDNYYPGWNATIDGHRVPVQQVDYTFRGVRIPPGTHTVTFRYEPLSWTIGWIVSLASLAALVLALTIGIRRRRAQMRTAES